MPVSSNAPRKRPPLPRLIEVMYRTLTKPELTAALEAASGQLPRKNADVMSQGLKDARAPPPKHDACEVGADSPGAGALGRGRHLRLGCGRGGVVGAAMLPRRAKGLHPAACWQNAAPCVVPQAHARRARCAAFSAVSALLRSTQTATRFYAMALDSKDDRSGGGGLEVGVGLGWGAGGRGGRWGWGSGLGMEAVHGLLTSGLTGVLQRLAPCLECPSVCVQRARPAPAPARTPRSPAKLWAGLVDPGLPCNFDVAPPYVASEAARGAARARLDRARTALAVRGGARLGAVHRRLGKRRPGNDAARAGGALGLALWCPRPASRACVPLTSNPRFHPPLPTPPRGRPQAAHQAARARRAAAAFSQSQGLWSTQRMASLAAASLGFGATTSSLGLGGASLAGGSLGPGTFGGSLTQPGAGGAGGASQGVWGGGGPASLGFGAPVGARAGGAGATQGGRDACNGLPAAITRVTAKQLGTAVCLALAVHACAAGRHQNQPPLPAPSRRRPAGAATQQPASPGAAPGGALPPALPLAPQGEEQEEEEALALAFLARATADGYGRADGGPGAAAAAHTLSTPDAAAGAAGAAAAHSSSPEAVGFFGGGLPVVEDGYDSHPCMVALVQLLERAAALSGPPGPSREVRARGARPIPGFGRSRCPAVPVGRRSREAKRQVPVSNRDPPAGPIAAD